MQMSEQILLNQKKLCKYCRTFVLPAAFRRHRTIHPAFSTPPSLDSNFSRHRISTIENELNGIN
jgi:hypothetical protein